MADIGQAADGTARSLQELQREVRAFASDLRSRRTGESKMFESAMEANEQHTDAILDEAKVLKQTEKIQKKINRDRQKELKLTNDINNARKRLEALTNAGQQNTKQYSKVLQEVNKKEKARSVISERLTKNTVATGLSFAKLAGKANILAWVFTYIAKVFVGQYQMQMDLMKTWSGTVEGGAASMQAYMQNQAIKFGVAANEIARITGSARQVVNALGGTANTLEHANEVMNEFRYIAGGDLVKAMEMAIGQLKSFAETGVRPTKQALQSFQDDIYTLTKQTGMSGEAAQEFYNEIANDADSISLLKAVREDEREALLKSQRAMVQNAIAAGMTAEAAKEAAKMLNSMVAAKPIDRLKQAAKVRALGGALGVAGADAAAAAIQAGPRASAAQREALSKFSQSAATMMDSMRGAGLSPEIFATSLVDKLGLEQYFGKDSRWSLSLGNVIAKPLHETNALLNRMSGDLASQVAMATKLTAERLKQAADPANFFGLMQQVLDFLKPISEGVTRLWGWYTNAASHIWGAIKVGFEWLRSLLDRVGSVISGFFGGVWKSVFGSSGEQAKQNDEALAETEKMAKANEERAKIVEKRQTEQVNAAVAHLTEATKTNELLTTLKNNSAEQLEISKRQLAATLATEQERIQVRGEYFRNSKFTDYGYIA